MLRRFTFDWGKNVFTYLKKTTNMKNLLYVIVGLLLVIWGIIFFGFNSTGAVHIILAIAGLIVLIRLIFNRQLSK